MKKENVVTSSAKEFSAGRLTRARAAALRASGKLTHLKEAPEQTLRSIQANPERATYDTSYLQRKRTALVDVTNVCCENSFNAPKVQAKKSKLAKDGLVKVSKVPPVLDVERPRSQIDSRTDRLLIQLSCNAECSSDYKSNENQKCGTSSQPLGSEKKDSVNFSGVPTSNIPDIIDIDADHEDPQSCSLYAADIHNSLRVAELARRPHPNFMETVQHEITQSMRGILVDWLVEVSEEYKLVSDTLYLTVYFIDRFLSQNHIERQRLQLLGITCMLIASKYEEVCAPRVEDFCFITDSTYTKEEVLKMEIEVIEYFGFQLFAPTAKTFLRRYLRAAQACYKNPSLELQYLANYLTELTLINYSFLNFLPSIIAASAVFLAKWTLDQSSHPWDQTLAHYTHYKPSDLKTAVLALKDLQLNTKGCPLSAIRVKYKQEKFKCVAALSPPQLLETLF